jgi:hypothetical protein
MKERQKTGMVIYELPCLSFVLHFVLHAERLGLGFWSALAVGMVLAIVAIGSWLLFGPSTT